MIATTHSMHHTNIQAQDRVLRAQFNTDATRALRSASRAVQEGGADWFKKYLLLDFLDGGRDLRGVDCWGLIYVIYLSELGIRLPSYHDLSPQEQKAVSVQVESDTIVRPWIDVPLQEIRPFDMVILRGLSNAGGERYEWLSNHMGIVTIPPYVMHIEDISGVMHLPIMDTDVRMRDNLLSRRVRRIVRHEQSLDLGGRAD